MKMERRQRLRLVSNQRNILHLNLGARPIYYLSVINNVVKLLRKITLQPSKDDTPKPTVAMDYTYGRRSSSNNSSQKGYCTYMGVGEVVRN